MKRRDFFIGLLGTTALLHPAAAAAQSLGCGLKADRLVDDIVRNVAKGVVLGAVTAGALAAVGLGSVALLGFAGMFVLTGAAPAVRAVQRRATDRLAQSIESF